MSRQKKPPKLTSPLLPMDPDHLWRQFVRNVTPLTLPERAQRKSTPTGKMMPPLPVSINGTSHIMPSFYQTPLALASKKQKRRARPEARLDMHGMLQEEARNALERFLFFAVSKGHRTVLIITGKGAQGGGVLRHALPDWLESPALRSLIATYTPANIKDGGSGAWYIFLKYN